MPISVTCPSCHARFKVSEKFAGQTGPCPKCKKPIKIPDPSEEVVIHAPEEFGPTDASGRPALKPLEREATAISMVAVAVVVAVCVVTLVAAVGVRMTYSDTEQIPLWLLGLGAFVLGTPLAIAGYWLLRDQELEPHRGAALWLRAAVCGTVYAILWGVYWYLKSSLFENEVEMFHLVFLGPGFVAAGAVAGLASLELDFTSGAMHYGIFLLVTCLLRLVVGLPVY